MKKPTKREADRLAKEILKLGNNHQALRTLSKLKARLALRKATPMSIILAKVPGKTVIDRAKALGVARQTYYDWVNEKARPNKLQAKKLHDVTGFSIKEIRGTE